MTFFGARNKITVAPVHALDLDSTAIIYKTILLYEQNSQPPMELIFENQDVRENHLLGFRKDDLFI